MKKGLISLVVFVIFSFTSLAMAAPDPFSDVPAKHWAYDAVAKLAKAGIVKGYGEGTFKGDQSLTRYEMAIIVANAMTKLDKADVANKALIDKLTLEFGNELKSLGKRVETLEKQQGPLKITGFAQYRYEYVKNPRPLAEDVGFLTAPSHYGRATGKSNSRTAVGLSLSNKFDGHLFSRYALDGDTGWQND